MLRARLRVLALALAVLAPPAAAQDVPARVTGAALTGDGALRFLERLTDEVGGRMTGSEASRKAGDMVLAALRAAELEDVHAEEWTLASRWTRGAASASLTAPIARPLLVGAFGWTPGTGGTVEGPVVDLGVATDGSAQAAAPRLKGAIVLADFKQAGNAPGYLARAAVARRLADAGAAALLVPAGKPGRLLDIGCFGNYPKAALPMLSVTDEDAKLLRRLLAKGAVAVSVTSTASIDAAPARERNVVAEIRGREKPDEVVIVGAHLDSWDTAQGANDDGSGVAALVEAARLLRSRGGRARRTIRFVFFTGEEQAILGSRAYVEAHRRELGKVRAVLIMDEGAQLPKGWKLHGRTDLESAAALVVAPLAPLGASTLTQDPSFDQDHSWFLAAGVPVFTLDVEEGAYATNHHAITDTLDKVDPRALAIDTAVMASAAWAFAESEQPLPHLSAEGAAELMKRTGLDATARLLSAGGGKP